MEVKTVEQGLKLMAEMGYKYIPSGCCLEDRLKNVKKGVGYFEHVVLIEEMEPSVAHHFPCAILFNGMPFDDFIREQSKEEAELREKSKVDHYRILEGTGRKRMHTGTYECERAFDVYNHQKKLGLTVSIEKAIRRD